MTPAKRHFDNWIEAYYDWARDDYCPDSFHYWTGIVCIAATLGRQVWLSYRDDELQYPNMFTMLVSKPGAGKSVAANRGVDLLRELPTVHVLPNRATLPAFIQSMSVKNNSFRLHPNGPEVFTNAGIFFASEASNTLKENHGDTIACMTEFYDCPAKWDNVTKGNGEDRLHNVCLNVFTCTTFDYINKLVTNENIKGGFASRLTYIVQDENLVRAPRLRQRQKQSEETKKKLLEDLTLISGMVGEFDFTPEFDDLYSDWHYKKDIRVNNIKSEVLQHVLARVGPMTLKLAMILSAAESDERKVTADHWHRALKLAEESLDNIPKLLQKSQMDRMQDVGQKSLNMAILGSFPRQNSFLTFSQILNKCLQKGHKPKDTKETLHHMMENGQLKHATNDLGKPGVELLVDPNNYL